MKKKAGQKRNSSSRPSFGKKRPVRKKAVSSKKRVSPKRPSRQRLFTDVSGRSVTEAGSDGVRLQKILAASGFGSRRDCEELITTGRVEVDRKTVTELGTKVDPLNQEIRVDGESLRRVKPVYFAVYKPKGYVCTNQDPAGRPLAIDLVPKKFGRVFPIGRLDLTSEGLLLITNDGALAERLTHPKYEVEKKYRVQVAGQIEPGIVNQLKKGVYLAEGLAKASDVKIKGSHKNSSILDISLREGKNREIRRLLAKLNHKVLALQRIAVGPVKLGTMLPGEYRPLNVREVDALYHDSNKRVSNKKS